MKNCGFYTAKYYLCILHFILFVLSTILVAISIWIIIDKSSLIALLKVGHVEKLESPHFDSVLNLIGLVLLILAAVIMFVTFLGCFGAIRESRCMLLLFGILTILIFCAEFVVIGLGYFYQDFTVKLSKNILRQSLLGYYSCRDLTDLSTLTWDKLMVDLHCCGVDDFNDLEISQGWLDYRQDRIVPEACCILGNTTEMLPLYNDCVTKPTAENSYYKTGCYYALNAWLINHREICFGALFGINIIVLLSIFTAFSMWLSVRRIQRLRL